MTDSQLNTFLKDGLATLERDGLRRFLHAVEGRQGRTITIGGREVLNFSSNDYLGLAGDPRLAEAANRAMETEGFGSGASRLVSGNMSAHRTLEEYVARFKSAEAALVFTSGYMANAGIISALFGPGDMIFCDRLNHASIVDGILLSRANFKRYPHGDMAALEELLRKAPAAGKKVIVTDTVFSMDGDIAPLDRIAALAQQYGCAVMVDEAHALGVLGDTGRGAVEHFRLEGRVDIQMGTLSKAAGAFGAYCCGSRDLTAYLANKARSFVYTTGMPPAVAAASLAGLRIIDEDPGRRRRLWKNVRMLMASLKEMGYNTLQTATPIVPLVVGDASLAVKFSQRLLTAGLFAPAIRPPTVPQGTARLRVTVTAAHREDDIALLTGQLEKIGRELCIL